MRRIKQRVNRLYKKLYGGDHPEYVKPKLAPHDINGRCSDVYEAFGKLGLTIQDTTNAFVRFGSALQRTADAAAEAYAAAGPNYMLQSIAAERSPRWVGVDLGRLEARIMRADYRLTYDDINTAWVDREPEPRPEGQHRNRPPNPAAHIRGFRRRD